MEVKSLAGKPPFVLVKQWCDTLSNDDKRVDKAVKERAKEMLTACFNSDQEIINFLKAHQKNRT